MSTIQAPKMAMAAGTAAKEGLLVYGATGHTGKLVAQQAKKVGLTATLAGRNAERLKSLADEVGLPWEAFELKDQEKLDAAVARHVVVLHIAGPFQETSQPMLAACLRNRAHYLDITGEQQVIASVRDRDAEAKEKGVMLMPAVGYDAVPGDCLAAYLKQKLPSATHLDLGLFFSKRASDGKSQLAFSHGTMLSGATSIIPCGGLVRRGREYVKEAIGASTRTFEIGDGEKPLPAFSFPAAELICSTQSTDIPNITTYFAGKGAGPARVLEFLGPGIVGSWPVKSLVEFAIKRLPVPDEAKTTSARMVTAGEVKDEQSGKSVRAAISTNAGYPFTASAACEISRRVLAGDFKPGFQSPASVYGPDLVTSIPDTTVERIDIA